MQACETLRNATNWPSSEEILHLHVFGVGRCPAGAAIMRKGAHPGDGLYVTGQLGGSALKKHLQFEPRVHEGIFLRDWARAMIDVSDGLATDARHLAACSHVGLRLESHRIPVAQDAGQLSDARTPLHHALTDGEDFELLFCVAPEKEKDFLKNWQHTFALSCTRIGEATEAPGGVVCVDADGQVQPLGNEGFMHFRNSAVTGLS
ncbi:MAG: AIR synthase-related protein [Verrucomicrobia bacterium]|nr:AIR synthase-related protein [Verrucomicrobiota bacterium]